MTWRLAASSSRGVLEPAAGEHVGARARTAKRLPVEGRDLQRLDLGAVLAGLDVDQIGVQHDPQIGGPGERLPVDLAEPGRRAELPQTGGRPAPGRTAAAPRRAGTRIRGRVVVRPELAELVGARVVRIEARAADRPAAVRHPGADLEVERVERPAAALPVVGRAAEEAQPADVEVVVGAADVGALVERLGRAVELEAAALEQQHPMAGVDEAERDRDPGRARADHAQVALEQGARLDLARIDQHGAAQPALSAASANSRASLCASTQPCTLTVRRAPKSARICSLQARAQLPSAGAPEPRRVLAPAGGERPRPGLSIRASAGYACR